jgi:uncharacterized membrane protein YgcG
MNLMKRIVGIFVLSIFIFLGFPARTSAQNPQNFRFESFNADYSLERSPENASALKVQEALVAVFPEYDQNHGILRAIPRTYKNHTLSLSNISVKDQTGKAYEFTTSDQNNNKVLKIGNPNSYVHGRTIFIINYTLQDVTSYFSDHDEFFWDINGDQWDQPFGSVTANIHISNQLVPSLQDKRLCYAGYFGGLKQNCSITLVSLQEGTFIKASADNMQPRQTLSVVLSFKPGTFNQKSSAVKKEEKQKRIIFIATALLASIPPGAAGIFMFRRWRQFGDDPKGRGVIIPEYEPPKGFSPLTSDFLYRQGLRNAAISATIIDLAVKGYITIIEIPKSGLFSKKDYELKLTKNPNNDVGNHLITMLKIIFGDDISSGISVKVSDFSKSSSKQRQMYKDMETLEDAIAASMAEAGYFIKNPKKIKSGYSIWGIVLIFLGGFGLTLAASIGFAPLDGLLGGTLLAGLIVFMYSFIMPARTMAGVAVYDDLKGLKDYIKLAEVDRIKFLQSPDGAEKLPVADGFDPKTKEAKVKLFEKLLPYAMIFGLEKDWAKQFNDIYTTPPNWYQGGNWSAFNAGYLVGSLGDFNAASAASFASPSSSSGSGFSGGGAGGGGGGGGGGGW